MILTDELNHASIIDAIRLSHLASKVIYPHSDIGRARGQAAAAPRDARKLIVTDGVFSMEGDLAKLPEIVELAREHDAVVVVDDSHGVGVLGETGRGTVEHHGLLGEVDVITGTLGKALGGAAGGYVASSYEVCDLLAQRSRPQLFSNALPPTVACSALRAIELMLEQPELLAHLRERTIAFREMLAEAGLPTLGGRPRSSRSSSARRRRRSPSRSGCSTKGVFVTGFGFPVVPEARGSRCRCPPRSSRSTSSRRSARSRRVRAD